MKKIIKNNIFLGIINIALVNLPVPRNINTLWSLGSILGVILSSQIITGLFLTIHYAPDPTLAFIRIVNINYNVNYGWLIKTIHANGASFFFILIFSHTLRNIYFSSFYLKITWVRGTTLLLISIITAFLGYVLPWGQISFWGATVITNLVSAIPYLGVSLVEWLWGGFSVDKPTLNRFYTFHFIFPFIILILVLVHLIFLHTTGSSNPIGLQANIDKISFSPYFTSKDLVGFLILFTFITLLAILSPDLLIDPENFIKANPLSTPPHIQPEWYFLFAYSILRRIPNKLGGVFALLIAIIILYIFPFLRKKFFQSNKFNPILKLNFWVTFTILILLTWLGIKPVDYPFNFLGNLITPSYFLFIRLTPIFK